MALTLVQVPGQMLALFLEWDEDSLASKLDILFLE